MTAIFNYQFFKYYVYFKCYRQRLAGLEQNTFNNVKKLIYNHNLKKSVRLVCDYFLNQNLAQ